MRHLFAFCLAIILIFSQTTPSYACSPIFKTNYWYHFEYEIPSELLPTDVKVSPIAPFYDVYTQSIVFDRIEFVNNSDEPIYIVPSDVIYNVDFHQNLSSPYDKAVSDLAHELNSDDGDIDLATFETRFTNQVVRAGNSKEYRMLDDIQNVMENPQSPGGADAPPSPFLYEMVIVQNNEKFIIPITINYIPNSDYDLAEIVYGAPMSDYLILSDAVVVGEVIDAGEDSELFAGDYDTPQVVGYARVRVEQWLLGNGPDEIEIGSFSSSPGADCGKGVWIGQRAYFLLKTPEEATSIRYPLTDSFEGARTVLRFDEQNGELIVEALQQIKDVTVDLNVNFPSAIKTPPALTQTSVATARSVSETPLTTEQTSPQSLPYILGIGAFVVCVGIILRKRHAPKNH